MAVNMGSTNSKRPFAITGQVFNIAAVQLNDAWTDFILSRQSMGCTETTLKNYQNTLAKFITWLETQGITAPQEVTARHIRQYLAGFADKADWTKNRIAREIKTLVRFWHKEGYLPQPVIFDLPKVRQKRLPFLTAEQIKQVLAVCDVREKAVIYLLVDSGLRRQEACNLNRNDIDMQTGIVKVRQGKGKKDRTAIIGATTRRALKKYWQTCPLQEDDAPAFQTTEGKRLRAEALQSLLRRVSRRSGVAFSAHALRRSFATLALKSGMDIVSLQTLLGHSDISTTRRYIQWLDEDLIAAHRRASPIDNLSRKE